MELGRVIHGIALVAVSLGGFFLALGRTAEGKRAIAFGLALVVAAPFAAVGIVEIRAATFAHDRIITGALLALFLAAVVLAGVAALRRSGRSKPAAEATSQKKRIRARAMTIRDRTGLGVALRRLMGRSMPKPRARAEGIVIGTASDGSPIVWERPTTDRAQHAVCLASSGAGKTIMLARALALEAVASEARGQLAILIVDLKGDLASAFLQTLALERPQRISDVRILDPFDPRAGYPFNLNRLPRHSVPLDVRALQLAGLVGEVSTSTGSQKHLGLGARQMDVLLHVLLGALACDHPKANVLWAYDALTEKDGQTHLAKITKSERARSFLLATKLGDELRVSTASRLRSAFATTAHLERLVAAEGCIDWSELLGPGAITIIDLGAPTGGLGFLQRFNGNALVRLAVDHLLERPSPWSGHHARIVIDEAQLVASVLSDVAEVVLTTGRSRGVSLTTISQGTTLLRDASDTLLKVLMTNCATRLIGRLSAPDAELLGRELAPKRGVEESVSAVRAAFVAEATNMPDRAFARLTPGSIERFSSASVDMDALRIAAETHAPALRAARNALAVPESGPRVKLAEVAANRRSTKRPSVVIDRETVTEQPESDDVVAHDAPDPGPVPRSRWG